MTNDLKSAFLVELRRRLGSLSKIGGSQSLFEGPSGVRVYLRYSKLHNNGRTFFGLREEDLRELEGHQSVICFLWDGQTQPLILPFSEYEAVFREVTPASDGQYKAQIMLDEEATELYVARAGRFNVEGHFGWSSLEDALGSVRPSNLPELTHPMVQVLLGGIGRAKGYDVWIPLADRPKLDWGLTPAFPFRDVLPDAFAPVKGTLEEVDVVWVGRGSAELRALFEVEQSTPIYSGLLRFNDIHLSAPTLKPRFSIVANDARRDLFVRQLHRPTFRYSGLSELCTFLEYANVYTWHPRGPLLGCPSATLRRSGS